jgi:hypothetical protein
MDGLLGICFMYNVFVSRLKRALILGAFLLAAVWLVWRGEAYDDRHNSALPAIMCAIESLVLVMTGAAIAARKQGSNFDDSWQAD